MCTNRGSPWRRNVANTLRQAALISDGMSLMAALAGRESTALLSGALSTGLRVAASAVEGHGGAL